MLQNAILQMQSPRELSALPYNTKSGRDRVGEISLFRAYETMRLSRKSQRISETTSVLMLNQLAGLYINQENHVHWPKSFASTTVYRPLCACFVMMLTDRIGYPTIELPISSTSKEHILVHQIMNHESPSKWVKRPDVPLLEKFRYCRQEIFQIRMVPKLSSVTLYNPNRSTP